MPSIAGSKAIENKAKTVWKFEDAGASPLFPPRHATNQETQEALLHIIRRTPEQEGQPGSRWTLKRLLAVCRSWLRVNTCPGLWQLLKRLKIHWKHARQYVHSPDPNYLEKLRTVKLNLLSVPTGGPVLLFEDEFTLYRQPSIAFAYEQQGKTQPLARLGYKGNYTWRIAAALNPWTGQVTYQQARVMDVQRMITFYHKLVLAYPDQEILLVQDNWPIHYHPDLLAALQPQTFPYGSYAPPNWSHNPANPKVKSPYPIRLMFLPTYASWTNPIEKLWRSLKQEVLHLHRYEDRWIDLKLRVWQFLDQFASGSQTLLHYVGLSDPHRLYHALFPTDSL